jgi:ribosomal protein S3AE
VLTEGESNLVRDEANKRYQIEAERLFNIGLNLGATTNSERIEMVERLLDMEVKEVENNEEFEGEEVDQ